MPPGSTLRDLGIPQAKREADMITDTDAYRLGVDAGVKRAHEAMRNLHGHFLQLVGRQTPCQCDPCISVAAVMLALRQLRGPLEGR